MRKFTLFILSALICSASMFAESGTCGDNLTWDLTNGVLTISGTGDMTDWKYSSAVPWYSSRSSIKEVSIGNSVTSIGNYAFYACTSLTSVTIPNSVTSIGRDAFQSCSSLTSVTIPNSVTSIGRYAFSHCKSLTSVTIPNSVTSIENNAFYICTSLTSVTIPNSVTSIGGAAFWSCRSLTSVTNEATTPQEINSNVFNNVNISKIPLYVPAQSIDLYKAADVWKKFDIQAIPTTTGYTITWLNEDGTELLKEENVPAGTMPAYAATTAPTKQPDAQYTYTFAGWSPDIVAVTGDATYTATYTATPIQTGYTITWLNEDGSVLEKDENVAEGTIPTYDGATPTKTTATTQGNYVFTGWTPDIVAVTADATYTATFQPVQPSYNVIIQAEHGRVKVTATFPEQSNVTVEADNDAAPTFKQWSDGSTDLPRTVPAAVGDSTTAEFNRLDYTITGEKVQ